MNALTAIFFTLLTLFLPFQIVHAYDSYDSCVIENVPLAETTFAAEIVRDSCARQFDSSWADAEIYQFRSPLTLNNDGRKYRYHKCDHASPDGKYCADEVVITASVPYHMANSYRFKSFSSCPIKVLHGPNGWMQVNECRLSPDGRHFYARVMGWTAPQVFEASLETQRRVW